MKKRILSMVCAGLLGASLVGCSQPAATATTAAPAAETKAETAAASGDSAKTADTKAFAEYFKYMLNHGVHLAPSQFEAMFVSAAHTQKDLEATAKVIENFK